jgi:FtsP/CotA-like multicopper oxidase with cupredoxin domain
MAGTTESLKSAYVIGQSNFDSWSQGFGASGYLKVLPHADQKLAFKDPFMDWQKDHQNYKNGQFSATNAQGTYYSSWGPDKELDVTLKMSDLAQINIDGFGILKSGDGLIPWLTGQDGQPKKTVHELLRGYNGKLPGPFLVTEPGDTLKIKLENDLDQDTNLHTHGLHVSPLGAGDNVLVTLKPGETRDVEIKIPDDHFIGLDWYHPHLHGLTNEQVQSGLGGLLAVNPSYDLPDLDKFNPTSRPFYNLALNTFGVQQVLRSPNPNDPLNKSSDPNIQIPGGTPLQVNPDGSYTLSDAPYVGFNAKPAFYNPAQPLGSNDPANFSSGYGSGLNGAPLENIIHTVNGQYNPTLDLKTGEWSLFSFANMSTNAFHVIQLVRDDGTNLTVEKVNFVATDGDAAGLIGSKEISNFPVLGPGSRIGIQKLFDKAGKYYLLSNATESILGDQAPVLTKDQGFVDGHLIWGSQVLATIEVTGDQITTIPPAPQPYDRLVEQAQKVEELVAAAEQGKVDRERTVVWSANIGGAFAIGNPGDDTEVETFEGTYKINGKFFDPKNVDMPSVFLPMLGTKEIWTVQNASGLPATDLPEGVPNIPLPEWHPFHIHQNDFSVLSINGISTKDMDSEWIYEALGDTINLSPAYIKGTATKENPYGTPFIFNPGNPGDVANAAPTEVKIVMEFDDYPGGYVNHCHILFHEDAGMMMALRPILNTKDTWLALDSNDNKGQLDLFRASNLFATSNQSISLTPYGTSFKKGIEVALADVNYKGRKHEDNQNVTDNVTDVITIQQSLEKASDKFTIKVFDGKRLIDAQEGKLEVDAIYELANGGAELRPDLARADVFGKDAQADYKLTDLEGSTYLKRQPTGEFTANTDPKALGETDPALTTKPFVLKGNDNGQLFGLESAQGKVNPDFTVDNKGTIKITGGDGKFQDATGELSFVEKGRFTNPQTEPNLAPYVGTLTVNGTVQTKPQTNLNADDPDLLIKEINPFQDIAATTNQIATVASGDIDGDGYADIVAGLGGGIVPIIEIYSGKDYQLKARISPFHHETFTGKINLALGDVNGDNYDDVIVGQGSGGRGLVEIYDGKLLNDKGYLNGKDTAHDTALLTKEFQPYGSSYTGEVDVTSGYILQRPDVPNDSPTQTINANITTLAKDPRPSDKEQIQVFTYVGGGHGAHGGHDSGDEEKEEIRQEVGLTPTGNTQEILGSFADLPGLPKGEPILFTRTQNGKYEVIRLGDKNEPESLAVAFSAGNGKPKFTKNANNDVFTITGNTTKANIKITLNERSSRLVNELGIFVVDDAEGRINGIAPGAQGYIQAALARSKQIFSAIANPPNGFSNSNLTSLLELNSGANMRFYLVRNSTTSGVLAGSTSTTEVLFADVSTAKITELSTDIYSLAWKDGSNNSVDFKDLVVTVESTSDSLTLGTSLQGNQEGELLDFRNVASTQQINAAFTVNREAAFDNFVGFFKTVDEQGGIDTNGDGTADILPGQAGYTQAAITSRVAGLNLTVNNQGTATYNGTFTAGSIFAPFLIVNGRPESLLDSNTNNDPAVYFPFLGANSDKVDHIRMLGNNIFGFEDLPNGGDLDYNDVIVKVDLTLA